MRFSILVLASCLLISSAAMAKQNCNQAGQACEWNGATGCFVTNPDYGCVCNLGKESIDGKCEDKPTDTVVDNPSVLNINGTNIHVSKKNVKGQDQLQFTLIGEDGVQVQLQQMPVPQNSN